MTARRCPSTREDDTWTYDDDDAFPVDQDKIQERLDLFASFGVAFIIEDPEDLGQYGLSDPTCTIHISAEDQDYTILLGDYSTMDSQRYVSIGDGNVYLVQNDPLDLFDAQLSDLIHNDEIPQLDTITQLSVSGPDDYTAVYEEDNTADTYRADDVYFTERDGRKVPSGHLPGGGLSGHHVLPGPHQLYHLQRDGGGDPKLRPG